MLALNPPITARFAAAEAAWYGLWVVGVAVFSAAHMGVRRAGNRMLAGSSEPGRVKKD